MKTLSCYTLALFSALAAASSHAITDITIAASSGCKSSYGRTQQVAGGLRATGTDVVICSLHKGVGSNNTRAVYARYQIGVRDRFLTRGCSVITKDSYGRNTRYDAGRPLADHQNPQSQFIEVAASSILGYMSVSCLMSSGDTFYGIRYSHD